MCSLESAFGVRLCACVCVCMQTETENNNKQSCERKRKRRRTTSSWQAHRESFGACYISILKSKRNITMYAVTVAVVDVVVVVLASCCKETLYRLCHCMSVCVSFFLLFFRLICFCCFSFLARWITHTHTQRMTATARSTGWFISSFSVIHSHRVCITTFFDSVLGEYSMCVDTVPNQLALERNWMLEFVSAHNSSFVSNYN